MNKTTNYIEQYIQQYNITIPWLFNSPLFGLYNHLINNVIVYLLFLPLVLAVIGAILEPKIVGQMFIIFTPVALSGLYICCFYLLVSKHVKIFDASLLRDHKIGIAKILRDQYVNENSDFYVSMNTPDDQIKKLALQVTEICLGLISDSTESRCTALRSILPTHSSHLSKILTRHVVYCTHLAKVAEENRVHDEGIIKLRTLRESELKSLKSL